MSRRLDEVLSAAPPDVASLLRLAQRLHFDYVRTEFAQLVAGEAEVEVEVEVEVDVFEVEVNASESAARGNWQVVPIVVTGMWCDEESCPRHESCVPDVGCGPLVSVSVSAAAGPPSGRSRNCGKCRP